MKPVAEMIADGVRIEDLTVAKENEMSTARDNTGYYTHTLPLRRDAYRRFMEALEFPDWLTAFAKHFEDKFGPLADVRRNRDEDGLPWATAYMVARFGETTTHWGGTADKPWTPADEQRARDCIKHTQFQDGVSPQGK